MAHHKFRVGQVVGFNPGPRQVAGFNPAPQPAVRALLREYKILRLLPSTGSEPCYRIKTIEEAFERVANESELELHSSLLTHTSAPATLDFKSHHDVHAARGPRADWLVQLHAVERRARNDVGDTPR